DGIVQALRYDFDRIISIDSVPIKFFSEIREVASQHIGESVDVLIERGGKQISLSVDVDTAGRIGAWPNQYAQYKDDIVHKKYGFVESFPAGYKKGTNALLVNIIAFGEMFKGKLNPVKSVSGPIGIAKIFGAEWKWQKFWQITGMLSFILAFMNILPIPALDGGHVLFLLIEMLRGKPLPEKAMYYFQIVGMVILFALMGFIIFVDFFNALF
ncbi:MAG: site-2 protease family protein, partial [Bacteroidia bacterium]